MGISNSIAQKEKILFDTIGVWTLCHTADHEVYHQERVDTKGVDDEANVILY